MFLEALNSLDLALAEADDASLRAGRREHPTPPSNNHIFINAVAPDPQANPDDVADHVRELMSRFQARLCDPGIPFSCSGVELQYRLLRCCNECQYGAAAVPAPWGAYSLEGCRPGSDPFETRWGSASSRGAGTWAIVSGMASRHGGSEFWELLGDITGRYAEGTIAS